MNKQIIINRLARICYRPKTEDDDDFAVQLFIEALVHPKNDYSELEITKYIKDFIEGRGLFDENVE